MLFCLAGAVAVFDGDKVTASARRLAWGGAAFGFAGSVKAWAVVPVLVVAALCLPRLRRAAVYAGGVAAGFLVTVLPFAVTAPRQFFQDVVVSQLSRAGTPTPVWHRLGELTGLSGAQHWPHGTLIAAWAALAGAIFAAQVAAWLVTKRGPGTLDWFATVSLVLIVAMFLWPPYFAAHYAAFLGPFLALAVALPVARLVTGLSTATSGQPQPGPGWAAHRLAVPGLVLALLAIAAGAVVLQPSSGGGLNHAAAASKVIPPGACVATDQASFLLLANRFIATVPGCSQMVDGLGTDLALADGRRPDDGAGRFPAVRAAWNQAFSHAGYVLLSQGSDLRIPWTAQLTDYFHSHFRLVLRKPGFTVYARDHG